MAGRLQHIAELMAGSDVRYRMIDAPLHSPPGDHLEPLKGGRQGQQRIRINDQWRICFP